MSSQKAFVMTLEADLDNVIIALSDASKLTKNKDLESSSENVRKEEERAFELLNVAVSHAQTLNAFIDRADAVGRQFDVEILDQIVRVGVKEKLLMKLKDSEICSSFSVPINKKLDQLDFLIESAVMKTKLSDIVENRTQTESSDIVEEVSKLKHLQAVGACFEGAVDMLSSVMFKPIITVMEPTQNNEEPMISSRLKKGVRSAGMVYGGLAGVALLGGPALVAAAVTGLALKGASRKLSEWGVDKIDDDSHVDALFHKLASFDRVSSNAASRISTKVADIAEPIISKIKSRGAPKP